MITRDYLIIGAGIGGVSVCEGIRQFDKRGRITLVGNESHPPYHRVSLSKAFLSARRPHAEELYAVPPEWFEQHKVELRLNTVVTQLNLERRLAVLSNGQTIEFNKAALATGSRPVRPPVAGANLGNVIYLRTLPDALALREMAEIENGILVVGGGFSGVEMARQL